MSTARFNTLTDASGGNSMPVADINQGRAKAWSNINGTGTVAIRDSFNVSSIIDLATGSYASNFTTSLANANYSKSVAAGTVGTPYGLAFPDIANAPLVGAVYYVVLTTAFAAVDCERVSAIVHGDT